MNFTNNSQDMDTLVQTYFVEETKELIYDNEQLDEWNSIVKSIDLKGQFEIRKENKSPIPFIYVNNTLKNTIETLCPRKVNIKKYNVTPIPLEILRLISLAHSEKYFDEIEIWYDEKSPDPFCVGITQTYIIRPENSYSSLHIGLTKEEANAKVSANQVIDKQWGSQKYYLLGKWGSENLSFEELATKAKNRFLKEKRTEYLMMIKETQRKLDDLELETINLFGV